MSRGQGREYARDRIPGYTDLAGNGRERRLVLRFSQLIQLICLRVAGPAVSSRSKLKHLTASEH
jgi:hypothetical protein